MCEEKVAHLDAQVGLFVKLPGQGVGKGLALLNVAAGKDPVPFAVLVMLGQEESAVVDEDSGDADFHDGSSQWRSRGSDVSYGITRRGAFQAVLS